MVLFFSLTTPVGIATGIAISSVYKEDSPTALTVGGVFNSAAAGILIYMALVDIPSSRLHEPKDARQWKASVGGKYFSSSRGCLYVCFGQMGLILELTGISPYFE